MKHIKLSGSVLVFLGAVLWSLNAPLIKFVDLDSLSVLAMRSAIAAAALLPIARIRKLRWSKWMLIYIISYAGLSFSVVTSLQLTDSAIAIGMQYTAIIWLFCIALAKGAHPTAKSVLPVLLVIVGVILFMSTGFHGGSMLGNLIALSEGLFFMGISLSSKKAAPDNPIGLTAVANLATGLFIFLILRPDTSQLLHCPPVTWIVLLILGVVQVGGGYGLYNMGLQRTTPQKASILALWEMILGPVWVALFLKEYPSTMVIIGFIVILAGMLLDAIWNTAPAK